MMKVTAEQMEALRPYIGTARPDERGELEMLCPMHKDSRRSAALNIDKGVWYCHAGCGGGSVRVLVDSEDTWVPLDGRAGGPGRVKRSAQPNPQMVRPTMEDVLGWHERLVGDPKLMAELLDRRGINRRTVKRALIGHSGRHYKIPIFGPDREVQNVRTYDMHVNGDRRKIWSVRGLGQPRLYPVGVLERGPRSILWCEGEWDALLALQVGATAVTRTGSAKAWHPEWDMYFDGATVYLCHDADVMGEAGNALVGTALQGVAAEVKVCRLPYRITEKHGKDLTDFLLDNPNRRRALRRLMKEATSWNLT